MKISLVAVSCQNRNAMDQTEKKNEQDAREFDFRFVIKKDEDHVLTWRVHCSS